MRALQKLQRTGNSTAVTIPRVCAKELGWFAGDRIVVERFEDDTVRVRRPCAADYDKLVNVRGVNPSLWTLAKIVTDGGSMAVVVPRAMRFHLNWITGESVILELLADHSVRIRRPHADDFGPVTTSRMLDTAPPAAKV